MTEGWMWVRGGIQKCLEEYSTDTCLSDPRWLSYDISQITEDVTNAQRHTVVYLSSI